MKWRLLKENEKSAFNAFMAENPKGHILQTWEWGQVKGTGAWQPLRLVVEEGQSIAAACSILKRKLPLGLGSIFYAPRGPVLDIENTQAWEALCQGIKALAKEERAIFCKIDPDIPQGQGLWEERLQHSGFKQVMGEEGFEGIQPRHVFRLDISPPSEELLASCHQKTRYNIRLAGRKGVVVEARGQEDLPEFYRLLRITAQRDKFLIRPYAYFEAIYEYLAPQGMAQLFLAHHEGKALSGALAFLLGDKAWYVYGASSNEQRNLMPNYLMQWTMIEWAKEQGCTLYDFRGVPGDVGEEHPLYGLVKFKRGFNGVYTSFIGEYDLVCRPLAYKLYGFFEPRYQKLVRRLIRGKKRLKKAFRS